MEMKKFASDITILICEDFGSAHAFQLYFSSLVPDFALSLPLCSQWKVGMSFLPFLLYLPLLLEAEPLQREETYTVKIDPHEMGKWGRAYLQQMEQVLFAQLQCISCAKPNKVLWTLYTLFVNYYNIR